MCYLRVFYISINSHFLAIAYRKLLYMSIRKSNRRLFALTSTTSLPQAFRTPTASVIRLPMTRKILEGFPVLCARCFSPVALLSVPRDRLNLAHLGVPSSVWLSFVITPQLSRLRSYALRKTTLYATPIAGAGPQLLPTCFHSLYVCLWAPLGAILP